MNEKDTPMSPRDLVLKIIASRRSLNSEGLPPLLREEETAEGGCGVIGIACSEQIPARHLLQSLAQMRNRGNGKGGGMAAVGLAPEEFGVSREILHNDTLLAVAYLDPDSRRDLEKKYVSPLFEVDHVRQQPHLPDFRALPGLEVAPPEVVEYFVRPKAEVMSAFAARSHLEGCTPEQLAEEFVYQNSYMLNREFYASTGDKRAFVLSHAKNLLVLKMVGYGEDVVRYYQVEDMHAHIWIGHHRYPTRGHVWHPGGAHPFVGLNEALVHNGDFANYASICEYLAQRNIRPLYLTDTEVSVLVFDLLHRTYNYPLEYVIEALAPTTERDFVLLPPEKSRQYEQLQITHMHASPDGPWFFLIAQSDPRGPAYRLIGITDTSMLRPQVFALQENGEVAIGFAASEKQAIDAALQSLAGEDSRFWGRADRYWNARGGSHTDGGAFLFTVQPDGKGRTRLVCTDKFGRSVSAPGSLPYQVVKTAPPAVPLPIPPGDGEALFRWVTERLPGWSYDEVRSLLTGLKKLGDQKGRRADVLRVLTLLCDRRYPIGDKRRSSLLSLFDECFEQALDEIRRMPGDDYCWVSFGSPLPDLASERQTVILDARDFPPQGGDSLAACLRRLVAAGFCRLMVVNARGQRFIGNGLGTETQRLRIDVYGSSGDYLASGIDGMEIYVHNNGQDQLAQIMKSGKLVVYGDVGQTFMYGAKGGETYVLGNTAGRPLINAVGRPRVVINGTSLDYLAESFMAGEALNGGGFVVLNGVKFDENGGLSELKAPYPGGNLFSLASGGAIYVRDPHSLVEDGQLNGGEFVPFTGADWDLIRPHLEENERLFGIRLADLLQVDGQSLPPESVYRKIQPRAMRALQAEEAWVKKEA
jgi:glutamate synthase domain-containing protein 1/glutamate synthase domain-containing protein 3